MSDIDCQMTIGVMPYDDGSGFRYTVIANAETDNDKPRLIIKYAGNEIDFPTWEHWQFVIEAITRALDATAVVGDDR